MPPRQKQSLAVIVGNNIVRRRTMLGLNQKDFAKCMGMGPDSLSRIESGFVAPRFGRLEKFASMLQCTVAELFYTDEDRAANGKAQPVIIQQQMPASDRKELLRMADRMRQMAQ